MATFKSRKGPILSLKAIADAASWYCACSTYTSKHI